MQPRKIILTLNYKTIKKIVDKFKPDDILSIRLFLILQNIFK